MSLGHRSANSANTYFEASERRLARRGVGDSGGGERVKPSPNPDRDMPRRYVQQLRFRSPITPVVYLSVLNGFWRFALKQSAPEMLSREVIQKWLCDIRPRLGTLRRLFEYARLVDRFLDWMVSTGSLLNNPLAQMRKQYGQRAARPIVRALSIPESR